ncbi:hypothetical protein AX15_005124 [Amanita polypyramis BW_CC]|nr:hypothetical protein AX15_005124 [Amanita polypyramis BW_CC]
MSDKAVHNLHAQLFQMPPTVPTVDDLRVKLCYICREEERYDEEEHGPPRAWTHPCQCTLIAHEQCLLKWIQTSQGTSVRAANALKCPQCGAKYELESKYPVLLRLLAVGNKTLQQLGRLFTLVGVATFIVAVGSSVYVVCSAYGVWALRKFIGKEMFDILLTNDFANWPLTAYANLPLIPISLILSRMQPSSSIPAIIPILLVWPPSSPVGLRQQLLREYWTNPNNARQLALTALPPMRAWPPSPVAFGLFFVPLARRVYRALYARLALWVLGTNPTSLLPTGRRPNGAPLRDEHIDDDDEHDNHAGNNGAGGRQGGNADRERGVNVQQRLVWQWNGLALRIRANVREVQDPQQQQQPQRRLQIQQEQQANHNLQEEDEHREVDIVERQQEAEAVEEPMNANDNVNAIGNGNNVLEEPARDRLNAAAPHQDVNVDAGRIQNPVAAVVEAAEQQIEVNTTSLGRQIGGTLLIPAISSWMGSLLFRLSRHSKLLREFLGVKLSALSPLDRSSTWGRRGVEGGIPSGFLLFPPPPLGPWSYGSWDGMDLLQKLKLAIKLTLSAAWGGTRTWAESDPVWWRNSIGLGLFVVGKDCLQLLHLWLTKRELETRRVKNRDFAGVDVNELDLIPTWPRRAS